MRSKGGYDLNGSVPSNTTPTGIAVGGGDRWHIRNICKFYKLIYCEHTCQDLSEFTNACAVGHLSTHLWIQFQLTNFMLLICTNETIETSNWVIGWNKVRKIACASHLSKILFISSALLIFESEKIS